MANAAFPTKPEASEQFMEELALPASTEGMWVTVASAITMIGLGVTATLAWWRKNSMGNADAGAHVDSIKNLQAILAAEREDHAAVVAALRAENTMLRDRADKFAEERNDWIVKFGEMSGELRAVRAELESVKAELAHMRERNDKP